MTEGWVLDALGREEVRNVNPFRALPRTLITGAGGSIGRALAATISEIGYDDLTLTDLGTHWQMLGMDVCDPTACSWTFNARKPELVIHAAGAKHAPEGEADPFGVTMINAFGTRNVLQAARRIGARVITVSTCKACDPETAYGASKLVAERMTLNAGGVVARLYNVVESSGNVFEIWRAASDDEPLRVTSCNRRFMSMREVVELVLWCAAAQTGRYSLADTKLVNMQEVAQKLYPKRERAYIAPRRGDRWVEPEMAMSEHGERVAGCYNQIRSSHDPPIPKENR